MSFALITDELSNVGYEHLFFFCLLKLKSVRLLIIPDPRPQKKGHL